MKVLVADDDVLFLKVATEILTEAGHEVVTAADGNEALEKAVTERPDLIVLDIILPKLLGTEVSEMMRKYRHIAHVPILLVSSGVSEMDETGGTLEDFKADDFLTKPFSPEELLKRIEHLASAPSRHAPPKPAPPQASSQPPEIEIELEEMEELEEIEPIDPEEEPEEQ